MRSVAVTEGLRGGLILGVLAVAFGVAGLSPSFAWIPEALLLAVFVIVPSVVLGVAGYRAGAMAGVIAGAIGGCVGGLTYVAFGKPVLNVVVGLLAGALGGGVVGAIGARFGVRRGRA